ncbi:MAG TPA: hypothetical protein VGJ28_02825, partial [Micromonosporaceae bacterium]
DRAYVAQRRAAGPDTRDLVVSSGYTFAAIGQLSDVYLAILDHPIPMSGLRAVGRYAEPGEVDAAVAASADAGLVTGGDPVALTGTGRQLMLAFADTIAARAAPAIGVTALLGTLIDAGRSDAGPGFAAMTPPYEPESATEPMRYAHRLGAFRHHRADAHAAAWAAHGLTAAEMLALDDPDLRRAIEDDTNRRDEPVYTVLTDTERESLLRLLGA